MHESREAERQLSAERTHREQDKVLHAEAMQRIEQLTAAADAMKRELERERETRHKMEQESQRRFEALRLLSGVPQFSELKRARNPF